MGIVIENNSVTSLSILLKLMKFFIEYRLLKVNYQFKTFSDDMLIKLWNWEKQWVCQQVFEGHTHYVMQIVINTKDNNTLASASLDRTVKV